MAGRTNKIGIATGNFNRNRILKESKQGWVQLKLISNSKNIDLNRVYIERFKLIGLSTYIKVNHNTDIKRSNISEISTIDGTVLWEKENSNTKLKNFKKRIMAYKIEDYEGKRITLIYDGSDLPTGRIGPQEINGKLTKVATYKCRLETRNNEILELITNDIQLESIKILKN